MYDDYKSLADNLFEGFSGIQVSIEGWSADFPQSLKVDLTVDPFKLLQDMEGGTLGQPDEQPFTIDPLTLLSVANSASWRFEGEFNRSKSAEDFFKVADDSCWDPNNFTARQKTAFFAVCGLLDALYKGVCEDWDGIGDAVYKINESEDLDVPAGVKLPRGAECLQIEVKKGSNYWESIPMSDLQEQYLEYCLIAKGEMNGGELTITITDADDDELAQFDSDGIVLWKDDAALAEIINKMIGEYGGLEQYIPRLEEAA